MENNLVRFGIQAVTYSVLLNVARSRQREQHLPREKLLVWGFGLGAASAILMIIFVSIQMLGIVERQAVYAFLVPTERALMMASILVVAGAFLHYILDHERLARAYIRIGLVISFICLMIAWWLWPRYLAVLTEASFHTVWVSWIFQAPSAVLILIAIILLRNKRNWLANIVTIALTSYLLGDLFFLFNYATGRAHNRITCPIGNSFYLLTIPLLAYVYLREQTIERKEAQKDLEAYRQHLEELVDERTAELKEEVLERKQTERAFEQLSRRYELILGSAGEGICGIDRQGCFSFVNPAAARMLGYEVSELVGKPCHATCHHSRADRSPYPIEECPICSRSSQEFSSHGEDEIFWKKDQNCFPIRYICNPTYQSGELTGSVLVFRDITVRKRSEAELAQRTANLAAQNAIAAALSRSLDLGAILDTALDEVVSVMKAELGLIFLWDPDQKKLNLQSSRGPILPDGGKVSAQDCYCCEAVSTEAMNSLQATVRPVSQDPLATTTSIVNRAGLKTLVSVPLVSNDMPVGALTLGSRQTAPVQAPELELLTAIGQQIGMAVENAHLYQKAERSTKELTWLHQMSIVLTSTLDAAKIYDQIIEQSVQLVNCQIACVLTWEDEKQSPKLISSFGMTEADEEHIQAQAGSAINLPDLVRCQETIVIGDVQADPRVPLAWVEKLNLRTLLCVPIRGMNESLGSLVLMDRRPSQVWKHEEIVWIESFVNRAAVALMNANLHQQLEWAAALEERQRIAADMHDGLAQTVSLLGLQIEEAMERIKMGASHEAVEELSTTRETVERVSVDVRRSIASLQGTPQPRRSLQELLRELSTQLPVGDGPEIKLVDNVQKPLFLPPEERGQVMLVVQEALLNAHRHAQAEHIHLILESGESQAKITVEDDGIGFDPHAWWEHSQNHFGLGIIHARAARIGAKLQIDSTPGKGTRVILVLPLGRSFANRQLGSTS